MESIGLSLRIRTAYQKQLDGTWQICESGASSFLALQCHDDNPYGKPALNRDSAKPGGLAKEDRPSSGVCCPLSPDLCSVDPVEGPTVELGSGIGALKEFLPNCITTDIFPNPWLDRVENAYGLSFPNTSLSNLILFDVFHHLQWPGSALEEFARVVRPQGRVIMMEPGFGLLGKFVYSHFHHEPLGFGQPISWDRSAADGDSARSYYAAQANAWRLFRLAAGAGRLPEWQTILVRPLAALSYVASGGFSRPSLYPSFLFPFVRSFDRIADFLPSLFRRVFWWFWRGFKS